MEQHETTVGEVLAVLDHRGLQRVRERRQPPGRGRRLDLDLGPEPGLLQSPYRRAETRWRVVRARPGSAPALRAVRTVSAVR
ncbi:hypothetical protein SF12_12710 [Streptomyces sp. MBRL 601]|nr:hypothetical protein SF12_12710 [Streptomyces sp. MBRL 601]